MNMKAEAAERRADAHAPGASADADKSAIALVAPRPPASVGASGRTVIPRRPLLWLAAALLFTVPPMFRSLTLWVPMCFLGALLAKFWMESRGIRLRRLVWKIAGIAAGFGGVALTYGTLNGLEPGISLLLVLMPLKILEAHTERDFHVLVVLGWVLCLCAFFFSQDLAVMLYVLAAFGLLLAAVIDLHRGTAPGGAVWPPMRTACRLLAQALPLVLLLFFLFPRTSGGFRFSLVRALTPSTGMSDRLSPGSIASLATSPEVAFRVEFPDGRLPSPASMYWRGVVMWQGEGLEWKAGPPEDVLYRTLPARGEPVRQRITLEPHGDRWMFALDWPVEAPPGAMMMAGNHLRSMRPITGTRRYEVASYREIQGAAAGANLRRGERRASLQLPDDLSPAVRELAESWKKGSGGAGGSNSSEAGGEGGVSAGGSGPRAIVQNALQHFRRGGFRYSLSPGEYGGGAALDEFLFRRKVGFCEHYAASFATLMRAAGVPARVVVGYQGGQFNDLGRYLVVRQAEAHAWCEVWLPGSGWERIDPTGVVAPERVNLGFDSFLEMRGAAGAEGPGTTQRSSPGALGLRELGKELRLAWDSINYAWDARVLSFDSEMQHAIFTRVGIDDARPARLVAHLSLALAALLGAYGLLMWRRARAARDPVKALYDRFGRRAAKLGVRREPAEGPADFGARAARLLPEEAARIRRVTNAYIALRYSPEPGPASLRSFAEAVRAFPARRNGRDRGRGRGRGQGDGRKASAPLSV